MSPRVLHYGLQGLLLVGLAQVAIAYIASVVNWKAWILIVVLPYIVSLICNRAQRDKATFALPAICLGTSLTLFVFGMIQFMSIVTNPFHLAMTPVSLAVPVLAIVITLTGYGLGYGTQVKTKKV